MYCMSTHPEILMAVAERHGLFLPQGILEFLAKRHMNTQEFGKIKCVFGIVFKYGITLCRMKGRNLAAAAIK